MYNYKVHLKYDGSNYFGYATQKNKITIQDTIQKILLKLFKEKIKIFASGRTDRFVHALDQVISFKTEKFFNLKNLKNALNGYLPNDIEVIKISFESQEFNARFSVKSKTYMYLINPKFNLFNRNYEFYSNHKINILALNLASKKFIGKHNFLSFSSSKKENTIREIYDIKIIEKNKLIIIEITANGFLKYMARMIIGKLLSIGKGDINNISDLLSNPEKGKSIFKAKPHGLYLKKVKY